MLVESPATPGGTYAAAAAAGIAAILAKSGQVGQLEPEGVGRHLAGLANICRLIGMRPGPANAFETATYTQNVWGRSPGEGLQHPQVRIGEAVDAGQPGARLTNDFGDGVERVRVPQDGRILLHATSLATRSGDPLFAVAAR